MVKTQYVQSLFQLSKQFVSVTPVLRAIRTLVVLILMNAKTPQMSARQLILSNIASILKDHMDAGAHVVMFVIQSPMSVSILMSV